MRGSIKGFLIMVVGFTALYVIYSYIDQLKGFAPLKFVAILFGVMSLLGFVVMVANLRRNPHIGRHMK